MKEVTLVLRYGKKKPKWLSNILKGKIDGVEIVESIDGDALIQLRECAMMCIEFVEDIDDQKMREDFKEKKVFQEDILNGIFGKNIPKC